MTKKQKKILKYTGISLVILVITTYAGLYIWIDNSVKENIATATEKYGGSPEDALIAFLKDTNNTPHDRTHLAIWTLGQIRSDKAMPVLKELSLNDPEGTTCKEIGRAHV